MEFDRYMRLNTTPSIVLLLACILLLGCDQRAPAVRAAQQKIHAMEEEMISARAADRRSEVDITNIVLKYVPLGSDAVKAITELEMSGYIVAPDFSVPNTDSVTSYFAMKEVCKGRKTLTHFCDEGQITFSVKDKTIHSLKSRLVLQAL